MTRAEAPPSRAARRQRHRRRRGRRLIRVVVAVGVGIPLLALGYYAGLAAVVSSDVRRVEALRPDGAEVLHPDDPAQTYLLVGTGLRGLDGGPDSTIVVLHVPPQDAPSTAVVLPALAYVDVPPCDDDDGAPVEPYAGPLDSVLTTGGAGCLVRTVQQVTGLAVDHYLQFDVAAVAEVVESVGPVPVCLPSAVLELGLPAGPQRLDAAEVLALLRTAAGDVARRQGHEQLLGAVVARAGATSRVLHPIGTTRMLNSAADALTTDTETGWADLQRLMRVLRGFGSEQVRVVPAPLQTAGYRPTDGSAAVDLLDAEAGRALFAALAAGDPALAAGDPALAAGDPALAAGDPLSAPAPATAPTVRC